MKKYKGKATEEDKAIQRRQAFEREYQQLQKNIPATYTDDEGFKHYYSLHRKGDLPGDQALSWWTSEDWDKHKQYIEDLRISGKLGQPYILELILKHNAEWDEGNLSLKLRNRPIESYRMTFIDFSTKE